MYNPCIPTTPWCRYTICCGVPKCTTIPVPALPVLETLRVYPYPWQTLRVTVLQVMVRSKGQCLIQCLIQCLGLLKVS
jgi:hypothetical protein